MNEPTMRFSDRVDKYIKYRPGYPVALVDLLECAGLQRDATIADVGSGTGKLTEVFLERGYRVFAVEPNREMRLAAEAALHSQPRFVSVDGRAEATGLPDARVDWITVGQAFHWFEKAATRREFCRILREGGSVAIVWNERVETPGSFAEAYQRIVDTYRREHTPVSRSQEIDSLLNSFFAPHVPLRSYLEHVQFFDLEAIKGRIMSSSYMPNEGPESAPMLAALEKAFAEHAFDGLVSMEHKTIVCHAPLVA